MIRIIIGIALTLALSNAHAQSATAGAGAISSSGSSSTSSSGSVGIGQGGSGGSGGSANNAGNVQAIQFNTEAIDLGDTVPAHVAPAMTTTLSDTCMGSTSGGLAVAGFGGSLGKTYTDEECVRRLHARQMASMGLTAIAAELMCGSSLVMEAAQRLVDSGGKPMCAGMKPTEKPEDTAGIKVYPLEPELVAFVDEVEYDYRDYESNFWAAVGAAELKR